jgi:carbon-monoxide dehydrogenase large subunit
MELAQKVRAGMALPPDGPHSLDVKHVSDGAPAAYPNGCHVCEVEVDPGHRQHRGREVHRGQRLRHHHQSDAGRRPEPTGGVTQGIGQTLLEHRSSTTSSGQLLSGSFMDYAMPQRAPTSRTSSSISHPVPAKTNPLGVKGCGEAGCAGSLTSIMNAVVDALSVYGIKHIDMPASPARVWQAIQNAKASARSRSNDAIDRSRVRRAADRRRPPGRGVSAAHFVSHFYMLVLPPLFAFVRATTA